MRAKARLRAKPHRLRAGRVVRFRGRVRGPLPPRGKLLDLQAFDGGHWRKFATARTRASGRFRARYRFSRQARPRTYRFRVRVPREAGFPYIRGYSNKAKVRVRGQSDSGTSQIAPSGGSVSSAEWYWSIQGMSSASTPPRLPWSEPP